MLKMMILSKSFLMKIKSESKEKWHRESMAWNQSYLSKTWNRFEIRSIVQKSNERGNGH